MAANFKDIEKAVSTIVKSDDFIKSISKALVDALMPLILDRLKDNLEFNANQADEFGKYKEKAEMKFDSLCLDLSRKLDRDEQHSRLSNIRIYGIPEKGKSENTAELVAQVLADKLKLDLIEDDIDIAHRLSKQESKDEDKSTDAAPKPRAIICKFVRRTERNRVLMSRKLLKNTGIVIQPDLTAPRARLLAALNKTHPPIEVDGKKVSQVWTDFSGRIWKTVDERRVEQFPNKFPGIMSTKLSLMLEEEDEQPVVAPSQKTKRRRRNI